MVASGLLPGDRRAIPVGAFQSRFPLSLSFIPPSPEPTSHQAITLERPEREELHGLGPKHPPTPAPKRGRRGSDALGVGNRDEGLLSRAVTQKACRRCPASWWTPKGACGFSRHEPGWCPRSCSHCMPWRAMSPSPRSLGSSGTRESVGIMFSRCHGLPRGQGSFARLHQHLREALGWVSPGTVASTFLLAPSMPGQKPAQKPAFACFLYWESACCSHVTPVGLETILIASKEGPIEVCAPAAG